jgi:hypothetical protein
VSRRLEPADEKEDEGEGGGDGFFDSPLGWLVSLLAAGVLIAVFVLSEIAAAVIAISLLAAELVALWRARRRSWLVEAKAEGAERDMAWRVAGRRRSRQVEQEIARALERGHTDIDPAGSTRL